MIVLRPCSRFQWTIAGFSALVGILSCAGPKVTVETSPDLARYQVRTIAVLPFEALSTPQVTPIDQAPFHVPPGAKRSDINVSVAPPERLSPELTPVPSEAAEKITKMLYEQLRTREGLRSIPPDEARRVLGDTSKASDMREEAARKVTSQLVADAALFGRVLVYRERRGSKWGGEPASVGFEVKLLGADGTTLWTGNYYETQRPMNEDLIGFFERGGVFVTADELAEYGVTKLLNRFPFPRS